MGDANTSYICESALEYLVGAGDISSTSVWVALVGTSFDGDPEEVNVGDIGTLDELLCTNYNPGGHGSDERRVTDITISTDTGNDRIKVDGVDPATWSSLGGTTNDRVAGILVHFKGTSDDSDARQICYISLTCTDTNGSDFTVQWGANGIFMITRKAGS